MTTSKGADSRLLSSRALGEHLALTLSAALIALTLLRILLVSRYDSVSAIAILSVTDRTQLLLTTVVAVVTGLSALVVMSWRSVWKIYWTQQGKGTTQGDIIATLLMFLLLPLLLGTVQAIVWMGVLLGEGARQVRIRRRARRGQPDSVSPRFVAGVQYATTLYVALLLVTLLGRPWVPQELVSVEGEATTPAFVIGQQGSRSLLLSLDRELTWVDDSKIDDRQICSHDVAWWARPVTSLILGEDNRPSCEAG